jgi:hypothetical protein
LDGWPDLSSTTVIAAEQHRAAVGLWHSNIYLGSVQVKPTGYKQISSMTSTTSIYALTCILLLMLLLSGDIELNPGRLKICHTNVQNLVTGGANSRAKNMSKIDEIKSKLCNDEKSV